MAAADLTPEQMALIAVRFGALAEPARLRIIHALRDGEQTVGDLVDATGFGTANVSKHLQLLHAAGFVARRKAGLYAYYSVTDDDVFDLCDLVCDRLDVEAARRRHLSLES
jgi:DNA-binding transcriptional ArsR family regulator